MCVLCVVRAFTSRAFSYLFLIFSSCIVLHCLALCAIIGAIEERESKCHQSISAVPAIFPPAKKALRSCAPSSYPVNRCMSVVKRAQIRALSVMLAFSRRRLSSFSQSRPLVPLPLFGLGKPHKNKSVIPLAVPPPPCPRVISCDQSPRFRAAAPPCSSRRVPAPSPWLVSVSVRACPSLRSRRPRRLLSPLALVSGSRPRSRVLRVGRGSRRSCHLFSHPKKLRRENTLM